MLSYKLPANNSEVKTETIEVDKSDNNHPSADTQKKTQKKAKNQMAETVVAEQPIDEKKSTPPTQKSQKNDKNIKKKVLTKPCDVAEIVAGPVAIAAADTQDVALTVTSKTKKQKSKKDKKAAAAKQQQQSENGKNSPNAAAPQPVLGNAIKAEPIIEKKLNVKDKFINTAADSNKVAPLTISVRSNITHSFLFPISFRVTFFI